MKLKIYYVLYVGLFLNVSVLMSQNIAGKATYSIKLADDFLFFDGILNFTSEEYTFQWKQRNLSKWIKEVGGPFDDDGGTQKVYTDTLGYFTYKKNDSPVMTVRQFCGENNPLICKDNVTFDWVISSDESKTILGKKCIKATTKFRGRNYEAWFTPEIPIQAGPWKFYGLPGLIVQVYDSKKEVSIILKSLNLTDSYTGINFNQNLGRSISFSDFEKCLDSQWVKKYKRNRAIIAQLQTEFPNLEITDNNLPKKRPATELDFE